MKQACGEGISKRSTRATGMNDMSSRSHAAVQFSIVAPEYNLENIGTTISLKGLVDQLEKSAKLFFVDLAGRKTCAIFLKTFSIKSQGSTLELFAKRRTNHVN